MALTKTLADNFLASYSLRKCLQCLVITILVVACSPDSNKNA